MERRAHRLTTAANGAEALALLPSLRPDLIITDLMMPVMDGLSLIDRVRQDPKLSRVPIVMLTASGEEADRVGAAAVGVDAFVTKPFSSREMLEVVERLLDVGPR